MFNALKVETVEKAVAEAVAVAADVDVGMLSLGT